MKICTKCGVEKDESSFSKNSAAPSGLQPACKPCLKAFNKPWYLRNRERLLRNAADYRKKNAEAIKRGIADWNLRNPKKLLEKARRWRKNNPDKVRENSRQWINKHPEKRRAIMRENRRRRIQKNPLFSLKERLRKSCLKALKGVTKSGRALELLGMGLKEFRIYIQGQFQPEMTWENSGRVWHFDHVKPIASFDLNDPAQQRECFHWSNLQPLFAADNIRKGAKYAPGG